MILALGAGLGLLAADMVPANNRIKGSIRGEEDDYFRFTVADEPQLWRFQVIGEGLGEIAYHDGAGRLVRKVDAAGEWTWTHDVAGRLETERAPDGTLRTFQLDLAGNVVRETVEHTTPEPVEAAE